MLSTTIRRIKVTSLLLLFRSLSNAVNVAVKILLLDTLSVVILKNLFLILNRFKISNKVFASREPVCYSKSLSIVKRTFSYF